MSPQAIPLPFLAPSSLPSQNLSRSRIRGWIVVNRQPDSQIV
jgi:hypothetical protein